MLLTYRFEITLLKSFHARFSVYLNHTTQLLLHIVTTLLNALSIFFLYLYLYNLHINVSTKIKQQLWNNDLSRTLCSIQQVSFCWINWLLMRMCINCVLWVKFSWLWLQMQIPAKSTSFLVAYLKLLKLFLKLAHACMIGLWSWTISNKLW
jgi:hypothetical protein